MNFKVLGNTPLQQINTPIKEVQKESNVKFSDLLKEAIETVNAHQIESDRKTEAFIKGEITDLHEVMTSEQKASITLETAVQIQKRAIDAYNEIMRMQV